MVGDLDINSFDYDNNDNALVKHFFQSDFSKQIFASYIESYQRNESNNCN